MGGILFKVAAVARFKKRDLKRPDATPRNYDQTPFTLDRRIDMDLSFDDKNMCTPVYIKADAHDQLLLSEGVCHQLGILQYHTSVEPWRGGRKRNQSRPSAEAAAKATPATGSEPEGSPHPRDVGVPTVRVRLLQSVKLLPHQGATVAVQVEGNNLPKEPQALLLESNQDAALQVQDCLIQVQKDRPTHVQVFNPTGFSCHSEAGTELGEAMEAMLSSTLHRGNEPGRQHSYSDVSMDLISKPGKRSCVRWWVNQNY